MADILNFELSDVEIIEDIEFEEEIQRPEALRFFTLDQQLVDYFEKLLPIDKAVSRFQLKKLSIEIDRVREAYTTTFETPPRELSIDWIKPIYGEYSLNTYAYGSDWIPLFAREMRTTPNYYPRMITALPHPYSATGGSTNTITSGNINAVAEFVNDVGENPINVLGVWKRSKTVINEDSSMSVVDIPIANTGDQVGTIGYFIGQRGIDIPSPLANHPFLSSSKPSKLTTAELLKEIFPSIDAILEHGVPITHDPYTVGNKYLKIYDVALNSIPWNTWKSRFPPSETVVATPEITSVKFDTTAAQASLPKSVMDIYEQQTDIGSISPRLWLMSQEDSGLLIIKMLLSKASKSGLLPVIPQPSGESVPVPVFPKSTPDECFNISSFEEFIDSGVYRAGGCIPTAFLIQEKTLRTGAGAGAVWTETTEQDILKTHQQLIKNFMQTSQSINKNVKYEKYDSQIISPIREKVLAILKSVEKTPEDKADSIEQLIANTGSGITAGSDRVFTSAGATFIVCGHTLAELHGDLALDRLKFYADWTAIEDGFRVCKSCGEQINTDVVMSQDEFDEDGHLMINYEAFSQPTFHGESHFTNSIKTLGKKFILDNVGEATLFLILSLLQVLPDELQILPVLQNIRDITGILKANKKIPRTDKERIEGILGIAGAVVILQTHTPFLVPRRSFGSKVLRLGGYPRDSDTSDDAPCVDTIVFILKSTFEEFPNTFKGAVVSLFRGIITKPKDIKKETLRYLDQAYKKFKPVFEESKQRAALIPSADTVTQNHINLPVIKPNSLRTSAVPSTRLKCSQNVIFSSAYQPIVLQKELTLWDKFDASNVIYDIVASSSVAKSENISEDEIRANLKLGLPKAVKLDKLLAFLKQGTGVATDGIGYVLFLNRAIDILIAETPKSAKIYSELRFEGSVTLTSDTALGRIYKLFHLSPDVIKIVEKAVKTDIVMQMILQTAESAAAETQDLRAQEREVMKKRLRQMNDTEREVTKMLLDIGIAPYIITNEDREMFAREYQYPVDPEDDADAITGAEPKQDTPLDFDEFGNGDQPISNTGVEMEVDRGDYGDRGVRDYGDYGTVSGNFDFDEGDGI